MNKQFSRLSLLVVFVMVGSILAACGGGGDKSTATPTSSSGKATATTEGSVATSTVAVANTPTVATTPTEAATAVPTKPAGGSVDVDALWFATDGQSVQGGTSRVTVQITPKDDHDLRVGFFESEVGGSGPQWRAAGWMAVITSSLMLGIDPSNYEFSFDVGGRIDGPSAGALMTVAVLADYLGDTINPDMTMTGTINPDGTIGPVGGIPHKLDGAAAAGKTEVLVPGGQRYDYDSLGQAVDLVEAGKNLGITVKLVPDIYTAYKELTGHDLPRPKTGADADFPSAAFDKYRAQATNWYAKYQAEKGDFTALPADVQAYRQSTMDAADYYASQADQYLGEGQVAAAYEDAFNAAAFARLAHEAAELDNLYYTSGTDPLIEKLTSSQSAETRLDATTQRLEAEQPRTASDAVALMAAFSNLSVAQGLIFQAQDAITSYQNTPDATEDDLLTTIYSANYDYVYADMYLDLAEDSLTIATGFGTSPAPDLNTLQAISETLRRAAEANITYFETLIIDPWAEDNGIHPDLAKYYFQQSDNEYLTAVAAVGGAQSLAGTMQSPEGQASVNLGSSLTAYAKSAALLAKYYSLDATLDDTGYVTGFNRQSSLADMLDFADSRAKEWLGAVSDEDPIEGIYYYDNARLLRTGDSNDQLLALNYYWESAIYSEVLAIFTDKE